MKHQQQNNGLSITRCLILLGILMGMNPALAQQQDWIYIVTKDDTLWDLSEKYFPNVNYWKRFQRLNGITDPKLIQPGTRLRVPLAWLSDQPVPAKLVAVSGDVSLTPAKAQAIQQVAAGQVIQLGDQLRTGANASASVEFADGSIVSIRQETSVMFDHLSAYSDTGMVDTRLRLMNGRLDIRAQPAVGPGTRFEIHTPAAVSAVRGTQYRAAAQEVSDTTWLEVLEGKIAATGSNKTTLVPAKFGTKVEQGKPPIPPRPLLKPPVLDPLPEKIERINWPLTWQPIMGARRYHTEVAAQADFSLILWERYSEGARTPLPDLPDGRYFVRVRGIDILGIEGLDRQQPFVLDARPQPPVPLDPRDGGVVRGQTAKLRWTDSMEAASYRLQLATDAAFSNLLLDQAKLTSTSYQAAELPFGTQHWRLASISPSGEQGPFGPPRSMQVKPIPPKPEATIGGDKDQVVASWQAGAEGQNYQVQVANDRHFKQLTHDELLTEPQLEIPQIKGQLRYLRVRIVEPDGYRGPWGTIQQIDPLPDRGWLIVLLSGLVGILLL
jgi:hypothetical protein